MAIFDPGDEGYDFILKVKSTKPDAEGRTYSDYSDSVFARKPGALGTEKEINAIMDSTFDLQEYLNALERPIDDFKTALKNEMLWDLIKDDWARNYGGSKNEAVSEEKIETEESVQPREEKETVKHKEKEDVSDAELLAELDSI
jgi:hypothetical protein